jgi:glycosyltransferase involved in cell wall biosynthesis
MPKATAPPPAPGRPLRVLLVANTLPPRDVSGVGEQVLQLAAGLRQQGARVEVLGRGPGGVAGPKALFPLFAVPAVWRALRRFRPDVVQLHESDGGLAALLVAWLGPSLEPRPLLAALLQVSYREERRAVRPLRWGGRVLGRPAVAESRFRAVKAPLHIALGWLTVRAADRVLAPSAATAAELRRDYQARAVAVVPNATGATAADARREVTAQPGGAAQTTVAPGETAGLVAAETAAADRGWAGADGFLLVVGRLRIRKGVNVLLAAMPELLRRHPAARLLIAGDGEHRPALEREAAELGLGEAVRFLGKAGAAEVHRLLRGAAALVVPSIYEGMPLVVLEAMDASVPVVASRVAGIPEVVDDGRTGWLVPPEDPPGLAAVLAAALDDPDEARRRGAAGRLRLDQRFRPEHAARRWHEAVLGGDRGTGGMGGMGGIDGMGGLAEEEDGFRS